MTTVGEHIDQSTAPSLDGPMGFQPDKGLGLNNQKLALFGLFVSAHAQKRPVVLPDFAVLNTVEKTQTNVSFSDVYSIEKLKKFAKAFDITILDIPPIENEVAWHNFLGGVNVFNWRALKGHGGLDDFTCQFFRNLVPNVTSTLTFKKLAQAVYIDNDIPIVGQLRIEKDWLDVAKFHEANHPTVKNDYLLTFQDIIQKTTHSIGPWKHKIYVVCDESNLPVSKEEIRQVSLERFNVSLFWKSDFLTPEELSQFSNLELSIIDFEMAVRASTFVGTTLSSFSNLVNFEAFCRTGKYAPRHYMYNCPGPGLERRFDFGTAGDVKAVTNRFYLREPLIAETLEDCLWPMRLTAHFSRLGDFTTETGNVPGARRGHIVCGVRGHLETAIEGFTLDCLESMHVELEYRALLPDQIWSDWLPNGSYAGTRSLSKPILGFGVRLKGLLALSYEAICVGSFIGQHELVEARGDDGCFSTNHGPLEAMQIIFRPIKPDWL